MSITIVETRICISYKINNADADFKRLSQIMAIALKRKLNFTVGEDDMKKRYIVISGILGKNGKETLKEVAKEIEEQLDGDG